MLKWLVRLLKSSTSPVPILPSSMVVPASEVTSTLKDISYPPANPTMVVRPGPRPATVPLATSAMLGSEDCQITA